MIKRLVDLKWATIIFIMGLPMISNAQNGGIESAAQKFSSVATTVKGSVQTGLLAIAFICGAIGLVTALSKTNVEGEQASKNFIKWFVAAGFFGLCWGMMSLIFSA